MSKVLPHQENPSPLATLDDSTVRKGILWFLGLQNCYRCNKEAASPGPYLSISRHSPKMDARNSPSPFMLILSVPLDRQPTTRTRLYMPSNNQGYDTRLLNRSYRSLTSR